MEKMSRRIFLKFGLIFFTILVILPLLDIPYIYAGGAVGLSGDGEAYRIKGYDAQQRGDIDTAIEWYQKAANLNPSYASPHNDLGILFETKGWLDRAEAEYQKAIAIDPGYKEVHTNLALLYERKGELEKAAFHWMRRYKLGSPDDPWTQEAKGRLEKLGLLDKTEKTFAPKEKQQQPAKEFKQTAVAKKPIQKTPKKQSEWKKLGGKTKKPSVKRSSNSKKAMDAELQESLRLAEERLKKERTAKSSSAAQPAARQYAESKPINDSSYSKAKDHYNKGEYARALDIIRIAKQDSPDNKQLLGLEEEIKFKMKEERIEDHYKEGIIHYRQKDFPGARKEFEAILSILPE